MENRVFLLALQPRSRRRMAAAAERYGYNMIGIADMPGNAMDPWVAATLVAEATERPRIVLCVSNIVSRYPAAGRRRSLLLDRAAFAAAAQAGSRRARKRYKLPAEGLARRSSNGAQARHK